MFILIGLSNLLELEVGENDNLEEVKRSTFTPLKSLRVLHLCHNRNLRYISHNAFRLIKDKWTLKEVRVLLKKTNVIVKPNLCDAY